MIEIKLNSELLLTENQYKNLISYLNEQNIKDNETIRIYIDSTSKYDYLVRVENIDYKWEWVTRDYDIKMGYIILLCKLDDLMKHLRIFNVNID